MKSGNIKFRQNLFILCTAFGITTCYVLADNVNLPNPAIFEPAGYNSSAEINTITAKESETRLIPAQEVPIPNNVNTFFAPVGDLPDEQEVFVGSTTTENTSNNMFSQMNNVIMPSQYPARIKVQANNNSAVTKKAENNPFNVLNNITLPSQYKKTANSIRNTEEAIKKLPDKDKAPSTLSNSSSSYVSSVVEELVPHEVDYEGSTISQVKISGLNRIGENVIYGIIDTDVNSEFNTERMQEDLQKIYALGYFKDNMYIEPQLMDDGTVSVMFVLEENINVKKAEIKGNTVLAKSEFASYLEKLEGLPQNLNLINEAIENINNCYRNSGYILAKVTDVEDNADGKLVFKIAEGVIEKINIHGNEKTKDYVIQRNILTKEGSVYNEDIFKKDLAKVYSTNIFEKVDRTIEPSNDKEGEYIVTVEVKEASSNNVSIGLGIDNALGGFGSIGYHEKNLFGRNQKLSLTGMLGSGLLLSDSSIKNRMNWNLELNFFEPRFISDNNTFASKLYYRDLGSYQIPLAEERRWGINNVIEHKVRNYDNLTTSFAFGFENIRLKEGDLIKISQLYRQSNIDFAKRREQLKGGSYVNFTPGIKFSTLDDDNMPREGWIANANFIESLGVSSTRRTNGRLIGGVTRYIPIAQKSTLLVGAKGGLKIHGNDMPEVMAFRLGGPYTIRGFRMNGVGSGETFAMASTELQTPLPFLDRCKYDIFKNLRFAFFADAGRVFEPTLTSTLYDRPLSAITMGVGLRINIPGMSTIAIDYGIPLTNTGRYSSQKGYFTFGTGGLYDSY